MGSSVMRTPVALALELDDPRPPRRDEAVLGRHEEGVQEDQDRYAEKLEEDVHGAALVLGGFSSTS